ncbi:putative Zn-dependent peptidase [Amycolatopsis bartoniae]|uniref:Peptidase M16 n=1 Tax=Amycolatopsis bartoniae TaxID=941986 RepID=A0A8H9IU17_9PSEU|nr:pitrilysin family protein [Amycolatopsis bartoniae]MBB2937987.1 putative Zn-dependent peptidase [Amycolatopsis bartoniae]TVT07563.1 insulinase family protein [Amycolatopsis bartoniae]GHF42142.1 peptidase M16 [Amycolatopsis bartoniae]
MSAPAIPALGPWPEIAAPPTTEDRCANGLRLLALNRPGAPLVEVRLSVPFGSTKPRHLARAWLLAETALSGTAETGRIGLAERIGDLGAPLRAEVDHDQILFCGTVLADAYEDLLAVLVEVVTSATYPDEEVRAERARLVPRLTAARSQAGVRAREILHRHLYGEHPYGASLPTGPEVDEVTPEDLRALHAERVVPDHAVLVLVGALDPDEAVATAGRLFAGWRRGGAAVPPPPALPPEAPAGASRLFHRPGSVQSSIRIGGPAVRRDDPLFPALQLANLIYGGYFSSRLVANIREDKGYTYTPRSRILHNVAGSTLVIEADVATEVTAPALLEMWYELGRLSTLRPSAEELDNVRQYAVGTLAMSVATRAGLATSLVTLLGVGLDLEWIRGHPARLAAVTASDIYHVGVHLLAPKLLAAVVIGDATRCEEPLQAFGPWEVE